MSPNKVEFIEGNWFVVPLFRKKGYAIGLVSRGSSKTRRGEFLGCYFGPRYLEVPCGKDTYSNTFDNSILICWTSDQSLLTGEWEIIQNGKEFIKSEWAVPNFFKDNLIDNTKGELIIYDQIDPVFLYPIARIPSDIIDINHLPDMSLYGTNVVRSILTDKLVSIEEKWS